MKKLKYNCLLLSDVIINQKAATEGNQETLDFIPGSNFLGIASQIYDKYNKDEQLLVYHSGKVRFGDAHPSLDGKRALRAPAAMYSPKIGAQVVYVHHQIKNNSALKDLQLKQERKGFFIFEDGVGKPVEVTKSFSLKSAYDREKRKSEDEKMFGYQALDCGLSLIFEIFCDDDVPDTIVNKINDSLLGIKRVGRSRSAQYGLVEIKKIGNGIQQLDDMMPYPETNETKFAVVYADSRLIFFDTSGLPTFTPTAADLGFENGKVDWSRSQIRTFQYAPWNFKRQSRDMDRCGIEKGSVLIVEIESLPDEVLSFVGKYQNEGFGKILVNPDFLTSQPNENGLARFQLLKTEKLQIQPQKLSQNLSEHPLMVYLQKQELKERQSQLVYKVVNQFVEKNAKIFNEALFASQWGTIRSIATQYTDMTKLRAEILDKKDEKDGKDLAYLTHGVAKEKWDERGRREELKTFFDMEEWKNEHAVIFQLALINLAAEMAKKCRR